MIQISSVSATEINTESTTSIEAIKNLINYVKNLNLKDRIAKSLIAKLNTSIQEIQANNNEEATNSLQAFINETNAQRGKKIPKNEADILIADAQAIIASMMHEDDILEMDHSLPTY